MNQRPFCNSSIRNLRLYKDAGVERLEVLRAELGKYTQSKATYCSIDEINACDIARGTLSSEHDLFILPGGRDLPYVANLEGKGNQNIREFVSNGGSFLGICAGAYYSSTRCEFERGTPLEVVGPRTLNFFKGIARGSVFPGFRYNSTMGAKIVQVIPCNSLAARLDCDQPLNVYFNGGCELIPEITAGMKETDSFEPLAYYDIDCVPRKIAIGKSLHGKGKAICSGVHPEFAPDLWTLDLNLNYDGQNQDQDTDLQRNLFTALMDILVEP